MTLSDRVAALERRLDVLDAELRELTQAVLDGAQADRQSVVEVVQLLTARQSLRPLQTRSDAPTRVVGRAVAGWVGLALVGLLAATGGALARSCGVTGSVPPPPSQTGGAPP